MPDRRAPLVRLLSLAGQQLADKMLAVQHRNGFGDIRPAHSAVFGNVPAEGIRLSDLAARAGMTKQAMSELVADLEGLGYLGRRPDPSDGRSKLIEFSARGWESVHLALATFDALELELAERVGTRRITELRRTLERVLEEP